jgi:hypothetical protein
MFAADHEGKLPEKLSDIAVPLPVDPFTGKGFRYEVEGGTAHVRSVSEKGEEKNAVHNVHVIVAVKK